MYSFSTPADEAKAATHPLWHKDCITRAPMPRIRGLKLRLSRKESLRPNEVSRIPEQALAGRAPCKRLFLACYPARIGWVSCRSLARGVAASLCVFGGRPFL